MEKKQYEKRKGKAGHWIRVTFEEGEDSHKQMDALRQLYSSKGCRDCIGELIKGYLAELKAAKDKG